MPDENKRVRATLGPYAGGFLDIPAADAEAAISDGWAVDPYAPADPTAEPAEFDQDKHDKATAAAEKAARKFRGEEEPGSKSRRPGGKKAENRAYQSDSPADEGYETRSRSSRKGE
jgi:hypothetical protein